MEVRSADVRGAVEYACARPDVLDACTRRDLGVVITALGSSGVSHGRMSALTGIPEGVLADYAIGRRRPAAPGTLEAFADGLDLPLRARRALGLAAGAPAAAGGAGTGTALGYPSRAGVAQTMPELWRVAPADVPPVRPAVAGGRGNGRAGRRPGVHKRRAPRRRRRLLIIASVLTALGIVSLVAARPGSKNSVNVLPQVAQAPASAAPAFDASDAISALPDSMAVVKDPLKSTATSKSKTKKTSTQPSKTGATPSSAAVAGSPAGGSGGGGGTGGTVTAGASQAHCPILDFTDGILSQSVINAASSATGVTFNCLGTFANPTATWSIWETPWMFSTASDGWDSWLANSAHQVVVGMDLIPQAVSDTSDPLTWESACASGAYNQYATVLAQNMVSYGAGGVVIRLGVEANGNWEADYVGTTSQEMTDWAQCFDNEVTAMRAVSGAHFLFVWNPNLCTADLPLSQWYPGNAYVNIIGVDAYDEDCTDDKSVSQEGWTAFSTDSASSASTTSGFPSLVNFVSFAAANGKPLSFPEWGLNSDLPDDPTYVTDMGQLFKTKDFAFESYFDDGHDGVAELGSSIPNATSAYSQAFG